MRARPIATDLPDQLGENGLDLRDMPEGHLVCNLCKHHSFNAMFQMDKLFVQCTKCSWIGALKIPINTDIDLYNATRLCDICPSDEFSVIRIKNYVSLGCNKCFQDTETFNLQDFNKLF